jgi:RNA recognition motif-containing protein
MNIYVGNLSYQASEDELGALFESYGAVSSVKIMTDRDTGRSRGFAFVEMEDEQAAQEAIEDLHESAFKDRNLIVNMAKPRSNDRNKSFGGNQNRNRGFRRDY